MWPYILHLAVIVAGYVVGRLHARSVYKSSPTGQLEEIDQALTQAKPGADSRINVLLDDALRDPATGRLPDQPDPPRDPR